MLCLALAGLLWGTGGLTGTLLGATAGLSPLSVAALRLLTGGALIVAFLVVPLRRWPCRARRLDEGGRDRAARRHVPGRLLLRRCR